MPWLQLVLAFLAGYGAMSLLLWLAYALPRRRGRRLSTSAVLLAGREEPRIEGILWDLHRLWEQGLLQEILILPSGSGETQAVCARLARTMPSIYLLEGDVTLPEAIARAQGHSIWILDLQKISGSLTMAPLFLPARPRRLGR